MHVRGHTGSQVAARPSTRAGEPHPKLRAGSRLLKPQSSSLQVWAQSNTRQEEGLGGQGLSGPWLRPKLAAPGNQSCDFWLWAWYLDQCLSLVPERSPSQHRQVGSRQATRGPALPWGDLGTPKPRPPHPQGRVSRNRVSPSPGGLRPPQPAAFSQVSGWTDGS